MGEVVAYGCQRVPGQESGIVEFEKSLWHATKNF